MIRWSRALRISNNNNIPILLAFITILYFLAEYGFKHTISFPREVSLYFLITIGLLGATLLTRLTCPEEIVRFESIDKLKLYLRNADRDHRESVNDTAEYIYKFFTVELSTALKTISGSDEAIKTVCLEYAKAISLEKKGASPKHIDNLRDLEEGGWHIADQYKRKQFLYVIFLIYALCYILYSYIILERVYFLVTILF